MIFSFKKIPPERYSLPSHLKPCLFFSSQKSNHGEAELSVGAADPGLDGLQPGAAGERLDHGRGQVRAQVSVVAAAEVLVRGTARRSA